MLHTCNDTGLGLSDVARIALSQKHQEAKRGRKVDVWFGIIFLHSSKKHCAKCICFIAIGNIRKYGSGGYRGGVRGS